MSVSVLGTAYGVIAQALKLKHLKDDIFVDSKGNKWILDKYGFHTINQKANIDCMDFDKQEAALNKIKAESEDILKRAFQRKAENEKFILGKKSKRAIKVIVESVRLSPQEKIDKIKYYINEK